jgi:hypothetical protein
MKTLNRKTPPKPIQETPSLPEPPRTPLNVDLSLLAKTQTVTTGANVHELNQIVCIYTLGCSVFNRGLQMPVMPEYAKSLRQKALDAETQLRARVHELEMEQATAKVHALARSNPRLAYFAAMLTSPKPTMTVERVRL